jgi:hypothetical protein
MKRFSFTSKKVSQAIDALVTDSNLSMLRTKEEMMADFKLEDTKYEQTKKGWKRIYKIRTSANVVRTVIVDELEKIRVQGFRKYETIEDAIACVLSSDSRANFKDISAIPVAI